MEEITIEHSQIKDFNTNIVIFYPKIVVNPTSVLIPDELNILNKLIKEDGKIEIILTNIKIEMIRKQTANLKFAGFVNIKHENNKLTADKKSWKKTEIKISNTSNIVNAKSEIIMEDELIDPYDNYQKFAKENDCITKPKACKNCNCGRADQENKTNNEDNAYLKTSACGKCYLGDAYRCAGCPYRGTPAFKPGDKIELNNNILNDNIPQEKETVNTRVAGSKIKIDLD